MNSSGLVDNKVSDMSAMRFSQGAGSKKRAPLGRAEPEECRTMGSTREGTQRRDKGGGKRAAELRPI